ncbi:6-pyruvoyl tetrahydropterin synthase family protein [Vampirovibrio sp.]|uniref:6-pyruvoyl trahydropterin synthase family protein n=1 Tax=Vampirovibrio sp. TaxID=2717857 RepID=UPI003592F14F
MFEVMVEKHFAAAHHLLNYRGKCENPHGHNYVVQVFAQKDTLDKANVAFDFTILKSELNQIVDDLDHTDLNVFFDGESPSAEYIARYVYQRIKKHVPEIVKVRVFETPTQSATYFE